MRLPFARLLVFCVVSCGSEWRPDGVVAEPAPPDAGGAPIPPPSSTNASDAGSSSDGASDASSGDGGSDASVSACVAGAADGCCPVAIRFGGTDPDCPSLACEHLTMGAAIPLDAPGDFPFGQAAMAWTGSELVLAWENESYDVRPPVVWVDAVFQRRSATGALLTTDTRLHLVGGGPGYGDTELELDPSGDVFFAYRMGAMRAHFLTRLPPAGPPLWNKPLGESCDAFIGGAPRIFRHGNLVLAGQHVWTCGGSHQWPLLQALNAATGNPVPAAEPLLAALYEGPQVEATAGAGFAFHPESGALDVFYGRATVGDLRHSHLDFGAMTPGPTTTVVTDGATQFAPYVAFDGAGYGIVTLERDLSGRSSFQFRRHVPGAPPTTTLPTKIDGFVLPEPYFANPSVIWTGDGFLVATTTVSPWIPNTAVERRNFRTVITSFSPSGVWREAFLLDSEPTMFPKLVLAGGRVAISWVRPHAPNGVANQHFLRFLSCR